MAERVILGPVQTWHFTCAEFNANDEIVICVRFGTCEKRRLNRVLLRSRYENATSNLCWVPVHYWVSCAIYKGGFFEIAFSSSSSAHICLALRPLLTLCLTLTN